MTEKIWIVCQEVSLGEVEDEVGDVFISAHKTRKDAVKSLKGILKVCRDDGAEEVEIHKGVLRAEWDEGCEVYSIQEVELM